MQILIADDDPISLRILERVLQKWGHEPVTARDGEEAWALLESRPLRLAIVDWMMPNLDGLGLCKRIRAADRPGYTYLMLLTSKQEQQDLLDGLGSGADDYLIKPFDHRELDMRLKVGLRILDLEERLDQRITELQRALDKIQTLEGLLPICAYCHKVRNDGNYWEQVETYMQERTKMRFSHGVCPDCFEQFIRPELEGVDEEGGGEAGDGDGTGVPTPGDERP